MLAVLTRPLLDRRREPLDYAIGATLAVGLMQMVPIPAAFVGAVAPMRGQLERALRLDDGHWLPVSISPADTAHALAVYGGSVLTFFACRAMFAVRGVRSVCRGVAWLGLLLSGIAIAQRIASPERILGMWEAPAGAFPFGPFVNRNHAATWLVMAVPLVFGYLGARLPRPAGSVAIRLPAIVHLLDARTVMLVLACAAMVLALILSASRSGIVAFAAAATAFAILVMPRVDRTTGVVTAVVAVVALGVAVKFANAASLLLRFSESTVAGRFGRMAIWQDTLAVVRDFWLTGVGVGSYGTAMVVYQSGDRAYHYNQAHNHYLQVAAEGGILLTAAVAAGAVLFLRVALRHLRDDRSGVFWIRAGAAAGLVGAAVQSLWETGLRMPANAQLAAVLAALIAQQVRPAVDTGGSRG